MITLPLLSIKKASAIASANSRRVEEWKSGRSITLPLPGVEEWKIATLPLSEWKSDRPDCPSLKHTKTKHTVDPLKLADLSKQ